MASPYNYRFNPWRTVGLTRVALPPGRWSSAAEWGRSAPRLVNLKASAKVLLAEHCDFFEGYTGVVSNDSGIPLGRCESCHRVTTVTTATRCCGVASAPLQLEHLRDKTYKLIQATPNLTWLLCVPDPVAALKRFQLPWHPVNLWAGLMAKTQTEYDAKIYPFVSLTLPRKFLYAHRPATIITLDPKRPVDWVLCRWEINDPDVDINIARSLRDQCNDADIPFYFSGPDGKDLDGKTHLEVPPDRYIRRDSHA